MLENENRQEETQIDADFLERADAHIYLANQQISEKVAPEISSNSLMYAAARFNVWVTSKEFKNAKEMKKEKREILKFFTDQYRLMLEENFENYVENYDYFYDLTKELREKK